VGLKEKENYGLKRKHSRQGAVKSTRLPVL
jgi:hypothetical protein